MIIDCISDLHGSFPTLEGGDLLLIAGDCTARDTIPCWNDFLYWLDKQNYRKKILVAGNHDKFLQSCISTEERRAMGLTHDEGFEYLCDSGTEFEGFKIWGSPWTLWFDGVNHECDAFMLRGEEFLAKKFDKIPDDTDILVTHSPPYGMLDTAPVSRYGFAGTFETDQMQHLGSRSLAFRTADLDIRLHVFGHIHEGHGMDESIGEQFVPYYWVNAAIMNRSYRPVNVPTRIIL